MMDAHTAAASSASGIERIKGHGIVSRDGVRLFETDYDLTITPPELRGATFESGNEPHVTPDITGRLLGPLYESEPLAQGATLALEDGRAFDFRVIQPDTNEIVGVSWFREADTPARRVESEG
jgi:hypothetical protein